jgi:anti-sigma28 factor (negative regulator of flagellin synthesis)
MATTATTEKKASAKKTATRKYSPAASKSVETEVKAMKKGELKSGSGKKVKDIKQAIAIGLSEARKEGKKVPKKKS